MAPSKPIVRKSHFGPFLLRFQGMKKVEIPPCKYGKLMVSYRRVREIRRTVRRQAERRKESEVGNVSLRDSDLELLHGWASRD